MKVRVLALCSVLLAACGCAAPVPSVPPSAPSDKLGKEIAFSLATNEGALVTVPISGARTTVLDFFAPTCAPCKKSLPELYAARDELAAQGARLVLVAVLGDGESSADAQRALESWGVHAPFLVDSGDTARREAGVTALPATLVLDARGTLRWSAPAGASVRDLLAATRN
jgi:thiol-disulfide isomerase/thioredoxin